jgi:hypothetical protein
LAEREPEAALAYMQSVAGAHSLLTRQALSELQTMSRAWREAFDLSDWALRLSPAEAAALGEELRAVLGRYRWDVPEAAAAPQDTERVSLIVHLLPEPDTP